MRSDTAAERPFHITEKAAGLYSPTMEQRLDVSIQPLAIRGGEFHEVVESHLARIVRVDLKSEAFTYSIDVL